MSAVVDNQGIRAAPAAACRLCGARGSPLHADLVDRHFGVAGVWALQRCADCGLVWVDPRPEPDDMGLLYQRYHTHETPAALSLFKRAVRRGIAAARLGYAEAVGQAAERTVGRLLAFVGPLREIAFHAAMWLPAERRGRLLDVGCGAGLFLGHMQGLGWQVAGLDVDEAAVRQARRTLGTDTVYVGGVESAPFEPGSFDAVTLSHVIEHLADPEAALRRCGELLRPGGLLVVATPNARSLGSSRFGADWRGWEPPRHLFVFDAETLPALAERAGFRVRSIITPSAAAYFMFVGSAVPGSVSGESATGVWTQISGVLFWAWEYALTRLGRRCGEEVVIVAEKAPTV